MPELRGEKLVLSKTTLLAASFLKHEKRIVGKLTIASILKQGKEADGKLTK